MQLKSPSSNMVVNVGGFEVTFASNVVSLLNEQRQITGGKEAGGMLLGQVSTSAMYVQRISLPNIYDRRSMFNFLGSRKIRQIITDHEFYNSEGIINFLGEWHSHPEPKPHPSTTDVIAIRRKLADEGPLGGKILMLILGQEEDYLELHARDNVYHYRLRLE